MKTLRKLALAVMVAVMAVVSAQAAIRTTRQAVFQTVSTTKIVYGTNRSASLANLNIGDRVNIAYDQENGSLVAHHIADGVPQHVRGKVRVSYHRRTASSPSTLWHVRGIIQSVDTQAGTLTIAY
jgi:hypothetical protein